MSGRRPTPGSVVCRDCNTHGPHRESMAEAKTAAKAEGWTRIYRGSGDSYRCPACRVPPGPVPRARG